MKQRQSRRQFLKATGVSVATVLVAACQPKIVETEVPKESTAVVETQVTEVPEPTAELAEPTAEEIVVYWHPVHEYDTYKALFADFEARHGAKVTVQYYQWPDMKAKLMATFAAGDPPDFIEESHNWAREFSRLGHVLDLGPYIARDGKQMGFPDDWQDMAVERTTRDGKYWGVPLHLTCMLYFYNIPMFQEAGVAPPDTWEELVEVGKALTKGEEGEEVWGVFVGAGPSWPWFAQNGLEVYDPATNTVGWGSPEGIETLEFVADLVHRHKVAPVPTPDVLNYGSTALFMAERLGMFISGPWQVKPITVGNPDLDWGLAQELTREKRACGMAGTNLMIAEASANKELTWELLKDSVALETELKVTKEAGMTMPRKSWGQHPDIQADPVMRAWAEGLTYAMFDWSLEDHFEADVVVSVQERLTKAWQRAVVEGASPKEVLTEAAAEANKILQGAKQA